MKKILLLCSALLVMLCSMPSYSIDVGLSGAASVDPVLVGASSPGDFCPAGAVAEIKVADYTAIASAGGYTLNGRLVSLRYSGAVTKRSASEKTTLLLSG